MHIYYYLKAIHSLINSLSITDDMSLLLIYLSSFILNLSLFTFVAREENSLLTSLFSSAVVDFCS